MPHIHVPLFALRKHAEFLRGHSLDIELFLNAKELDSIGPGDIKWILNELDYSPDISLHGPFSDLSPASDDPRVRELTRMRFAQAFDLAEKLGAVSVVLHSGYERWRFAHNMHTWLDGSLSLWKEFATRAEALGIVLAVENIFETTPHNLALLMSEVRSDNFGICFDTGHFNLFAEEPLGLWLDALGPRIRELHLHDNTGERDAHGPMGSGRFDFTALFRAIKGREDIIQTIEARSPEDYMAGAAYLESLQKSI